ncbi:hypothetical protein PPACK8108_LOCUS10761 [Phakopsora pachyrhizi]|uniref:Uncharacterized protein n=1 Tax=Phakopsora pachyrhizi TaxID=170000 RepID=A0AAV0AZ03_PHAPC|nr:hypothetical protein PPACK8108_LOCUS10761 [Phakopsora pachyrhizi]
MHQPESFGFQSSINVNGAVETQVPEHQNLEESSLVQNHPLSSLAETEPAAVSAANSCNTLASEVGPTQQQDARELNKEGQSPNEFPENPHTLHVNRDHNISKKIRPPKAQNDVIEEVDLPLVEKQQYKTLRPEEKCILLKQEKLSKNRRSSSKKINEQNHMTKKSKETHEKSKEKKNKTVLRSEKTVKDAIDEFRLKLENLSKSSSSEGSLKLFLETLDKFADNKSSDEYLKASKGIKHEDLNMNAWNPYVELFLADNGIPICQSLLDKLKKFVVEKVNDKVGKNSDELFFKMLYFQTKENLEQNFYILPHQLKKFYNYRNSNFKVKNLGLQNVPKNWNYYSDHISKKICEAINWIPWKEFSKCDSNVELYEKREIYLKDKRTKKFGVNYGKLPRVRFYLRKLFKVYSTLINKVYCSGEKDLQENFHDRQKDAIKFFDKTLSLLEIDSSDNSKYFIRNENLPLNQYKKAVFSKHSLKSETYNFQFKVFNSDRNKLDIIWKIIPLWLASDKFEYYYALYCSDDTMLLHFRLFFNSLFFYIIKK